MHIQKLTLRGAGLELRDRLALGVRDDDILAMSSRESRIMKAKAIKKIVV